MAEEPLLLEVGVITKPHGLRGEVIVHLFSGLADRLLAGSKFESEAGTLVVTSSKSHQGQFIVRFEGSSDRNSADALRGTVLRAEPRDVEGVLWIHELIGCAVTTTTGDDLGVVSHVEQNPASDLLVTESGHLIPLAFVVAHEPTTSIEVDLPAGFLDL